MAKNDWPSELHNKLLELAHGDYSARQLMDELHPIATRLRFPTLTRNAVLGKISRYNKKAKKFNAVNPPEKHITLLRLSESKNTAGSNKSQKPKASKPKSDKVIQPKINIPLDETPRNQSELSALFDKASARLPVEIVKEGRECLWPTRTGTCNAGRFHGDGYRGSYCAVHFALSVTPGDMPRVLKKHPELNAAVASQVKILKDLRERAQAKAPVPAVA